MANKKTKLESSLEKVWPKGKKAKADKKTTKKVPSLSSADTPWPSKKKTRKIVEPEKLGTAPKATILRFAGDFIDQVSPSGTRSSFDDGKPEAVMTNGEIISLKPVPPKKLLLQALTTITKRLVESNERGTTAASVGKATVSNLVGDLRRQDLLTRKEAITLNKRYGLGLTL